MAFACTARRATASASGSEHSLPRPGSRTPNEKILPAHIVGRCSVAVLPNRSTPAALLTGHPGLFFKPVEFHLQLSYLLVKFRLHLLVGFSSMVSPVREHF